MTVGGVAVSSQSQVASFVPNMIGVLCHMDIPKQQEQSAEERIGSMIGKIIVLALIAFFVWGYASTLAAKLGLF
jgi:hypothetical protein